MTRAYLSCTTRWYRIFLTVLFAVACLSLVQAQVSTTGKIAGVVTDASGASVASASITVKGSALMADRTSPAQADGSYLFDLLPPGTYEMTTSAQGFQTLRQTGIVINAGFTATIEFPPPGGPGTANRHGHGRARDRRPKRSDLDHLQPAVAAGHSCRPRPVVHGGSDAGRLRCLVLPRRRLTLAATRACSSPPCRCTAARRESRFSVSTAST